MPLEGEILPTAIQVAGIVPAGLDIIRRQGGVRVGYMKGFPRDRYQKL